MLLKIKIIIRKYIVNLRLRSYTSIVVYDLRLKDSRLIRFDFFYQEVGQIIFIVIVEKNMELLSVVLLFSSKKVILYLQNYYLLVY